MPKASARNFYAKSLKEDERTAMQAARNLDGLDEEIAMLRVRLRTALGEHSDDYPLLMSGVSTLAKTLATRYRMSPKAGKDLGERMAGVLRSIGDQILPPE